MNTNVLIYILTIFMTLLIAPCASALHVEDVLDSIQVEVRAEVIAPCGFSLGTNYLSFTAQATDSATVLLYKAKPIEFSVNCPSAAKYHYAFQTTEVKTNTTSRKDCAKGFNVDGNNDDYILFCIRDDNMVYYDALTEVTAEDIDKSFTGTMPPGLAEDAVITDSLLFYPWEVAAASGQYIGILNVVFFVD